MVTCPIGIGLVMNVDEQFEIDYNIGECGGGKMVDHNINNKITKNFPPNNQGK